MHKRFIANMLKPFGDIKPNETLTALLMFLYSFTVMTAYNAIKPAMRSQYIKSLGPDNLPYVLLVAGILIGFAMASYSRLITRLPHRWCLTIAQSGITAILLVFWILFRSTQAKWVSVAFYLFGSILAVLLISQFWTLANIVFDPRQAKRLFGFIGGGASLGGIVGSFAAKNAHRIGTANLLLFSAGFMVLSIVAVSLIVRREGVGEELQRAAAGAGKGVSFREAILLLKKSKHLRLIALVISFAAIGASIIDWQLSKAATEVIGQHATEAITAFLADVQFWASLIGFLIQILLTSRIHRYLGIGIALLLLPISLGSTAIVILLNPALWAPRLPALWAPRLARVADQSLRFSIDKTTREVLYMPLPSDLKFAAKPFVDVTVDRFAEAVAAILLLFLIQPWGLGLTWERLSFASIVMAGLWIFLAFKAKQGYKEAFRNSVDMRQIKPVEVTVAAADLSTIETLIQELASPDEQRVVYAIEFLESLDKRHLITPLLLYHESPAVRARALSVMSIVQPEISTRWLPAIQAMMRDPDPNVRSEAVGALARMQNQQASDLVRPLLQDKNPRISLTAAMLLAGSGLEEDAVRAEEVLSGLLSDTRESAAPVRRDFAIAVRHVPIPHFRRLLIPLLNDPNPEVADEAMRSTKKLGATDFVFISTLISLLGNRRQKSNARELLVDFGEPVLPILGHFLRDPGEDPWVRRHIPATMARIPCQMAMDILVEGVNEKDGFLRFHIIAALERIHRIKPELSFNRSRIESLIQEESTRYAKYRRLHRLLFESRFYPGESLVARALVEKMKRGVDRIYRLLGLLYPWKEIASARHTIEHGDTRSRAGTLEYLDNLLAGGLRKTLIPLFEDTLSGEEGLSSNGSRSGVEEAIRRLIHDEDPVVASAAIYFVQQQKLSNFAEELDRVLATRDPKDRHVLETASWALQEFRAPSLKPRLIWLEPLPSADLANQMRQLPLFGSITVDEIFRICDMGRQVRSEPGHMLCLESQVPETIQFLLNGRVAVTRKGEQTNHIEAPAVLAFQEVLEERPMAESVKTTDMTVCLTLTNEEIQALMADNNNLVPGLFQMLCRNSQSLSGVVQGYPLTRSALPAGGNYNPIEKGLVLKTIPIFSQISPDEIITLASIATELHLTPGSSFLAEGDSPAIYALISGELSIEGSNGLQTVARASDIIGIYESLTATDFEFRARVITGGYALRIDREDLFDLLTQRSSLLRQVFRALFRNHAALTSATC